MGGSVGCEGMVCLENVYKEYTSRAGAVIALRGVTLTLGEGLHAVVGPNGSGKSTLLQVIAGVTRPDRGRVVVDGRELWSGCSGDCLAAMRRRLVGYVPQTLLLPAPMKAVDAVALPLLIDGVRDWRRRVERAAGMLGIEGLLERRISELSVGQRQLVANARALAPDPRILLLDEPLSHLDRNAAGRVLDPLSSIKTGRLVLVTDTGTVDASSYFDTIYCIERGELRREGCRAP